VVLVSRAVRVFHADPVIVCEDCDEIEIAAEVDGLFDAVVVRVDVDDSGADLVIHAVGVSLFVGYADGVGRVDRVEVFDAVADVDGRMPLSIRIRTPRLSTEATEATEAIRPGEKAIHDSKRSRRI